MPSFGEDAYGQRVCPARSHLGTFLTAIEKVLPTPANGVKKRKTPGLNVSGPG